MASDEEDDELAGLRAQRLAQLGTAGMTLVRLIFFPSRGRAPRCVRRVGNAGSLTAGRLAEHAAGAAACTRCGGRLLRGAGDEREWQVPIILVLRGICSAQRIAADARSVTGN